MAEDLDFALNCKIGEKECYFGQDSLLEIGRAMKIDSEYTRKLMVMPDARGDNFILPSRYETIAECHKKNPDITEYLVGLSNEEGRPRVVNENYFRMFFRRMVNHPENIEAMKQDFAAQDPDTKRYVYNLYNMAEKYVL